jgi:Undecaprenyl-phosphate galactose phosphotransferase WbaP
MGWDMIRIKSWIVSIILVVLDSLVIYGIFYFSTIIRTVLVPLLNRPVVTWEAVIVLTQLGVCLVIGMFLLQGLYPGYGLTAVKEIEKMSKAITLAFILLATISYLNKSFQNFPRSIFPIAWFLTISILPIIRIITRNLLSRLNIYGVPVIVFGEGKWAQDVIQSLKSIKRLGWLPKKHISIKELINQKEFDSSFIAILASNTDMKVVDLVRALNQKYQKVILIQQSDNFGSLWVEARDLDSILGLEFQYHLLSRRNRWLKKSFDLIGALSIFIILSPLLVLLSILIAIDSPGPILYRQERLSKNYRLFNVVKFRTMVLDAEGKLQQLLQNNPIAKEEYVKFHKLENDPRVTRIGRILRKFSLDELPQLWNVIKGEMSLSGPRAYMSTELDNMGSYSDTILRVNPGMTGWWQVLGRHQTSFQKRLQMDEYYISNWSLWMDTYIFLKTILVVIFGKGV